MSRIKEMVRKIVLDKSSVIEFITWQDNNSEDNYAYLMMKGTDYPKYQEAVKAGTIILEDWGLFYQGKGKKPTDEEVLLLQEVFGKENIRFNTADNQ
jgi:hypothetical protein